MRSCPRIRDIAMEPAILAGMAMRQRLGWMVIATAPAALIRWLIRACPAQEPGSRPASARGRACRRSSLPPPVLADCAARIIDCRGIHLTGVAWAGGAASSRRALPEVNGGVPGLVPHRRGLPGLPGVAALAGRIHLPAL